MALNKYDVKAASGETLTFQLDDKDAQRFQSVYGKGNVKRAAEPKAPAATEKASAPKE